MAGLWRQPPKHRFDPVDGLARVWLRLIVAVAGVGLLAATLFPFAPELPGPSLTDWKAEIERRVEWRVPSRGGFRDAVGNMLLFAPLGFGLAGILAARGVRPPRAVAGVGMAAVGLSSGIEVVQLLIPSRDPSAADMIANALGGLVGAIAFHMFGGAVLRGLTRLATDRGSEVQSARKLCISLLLLAFFTCAGSIAAARLAPLSGWDPDAVLTVGGPGVRDVLIADRAMAVDEVDRTLDRLRSEVTPAAAGVLGFYQAGEADVSSRELSRRIAARSQFTLSALLPADLSAGSHFVTLSRDGYGQNLALARQDAHLLIRVSTPLTGGGVGRPLFMLAHLFADGAPHRVCLSFDGRRLRTYADGNAAGAVDLSPETSFAWRMLPFQPYYVILGRTDGRAWRLAHDAMVYGPLGLLAGLIGWATRTSPRQRVLLVSAAVLVPPALVESVAALVAPGRHVDWSIAASGAATAATTALVAFACGPWRMWRGPRTSWRHASRVRAVSDEAHVAGVA